MVTRMWRHLTPNPKTQNPKQDEEDNLNVDTFDPFQAVGHLSPKTKPTSLTLPPALPRPSSPPPPLLPLAPQPLLPPPGPATAAATTPANRATLNVAAASGIEI